MTNKLTEKKYFSLSTAVKRFLLKPVALKFLLITSAFYYDLSNRLFILKFSFSDCFLFSNRSIYEKKTTQDVIYRIFSTGKTPWTQKQVKRKVLAGWCHWWWLRCKMWMYKEFIQDKGAKQLQLYVLGQNQERQNHLMLKDFTKKDSASAWACKRTISEKMGLLKGRASSEKVKWIFAFVFTGKTCSWTFVFLQREAIISSSAGVPSCPQAGHPQCKGLSGCAQRCPARLGGCCPSPGRSCSSHSTQQGPSEHKQG